MALQSIPGIGGPLYLGPHGFRSTTAGAISAQAAMTLDAANDATIFVGECQTSDGGSHTVDTTGSSAVGVVLGAITWADAGSTLKVGVAAADTGNGPPARAVNVTDVITFDVSKSITGGAGLTGSAWNSLVPDTGTKTIANGDKIAICVQLTARGGADSVVVNAGGIASALQFPCVTVFEAAAYTAQNAVPVAQITFSDGATGWIFGSEIYESTSLRTYNSGSATDEYGQLYQLPFPFRVIGAYCWIDMDGDAEILLYSDPLGTPVAQLTATMDANIRTGTSGRRSLHMFSSTYDVAANAPVVVAIRPTTTTNVSTYYKTLDSAGQRITDVWGTSGYGVSRADNAGAFANVNSSLDHYNMGMLVSALEGGGGARIIGGTVVR